MPLLENSGGDHDRLLSGPNIKNAIHLLGHVKMCDTVEDKDIKMFV